MSTSKFVGDLCYTSCTTPTKAGIQWVVRRERKFVGEEHQRRRKYNPKLGRFVGEEHQRRRRYNPKLGRFVGEEHQQRRKRQGFSGWYAERGKAKRRKGEN